MVSSGELFPETWRPESLGPDAIPYLWPTFFAIYPAKCDLFQLIDWQRSICQRETAVVHKRPPNLLHFSVVECGKPKQKRQPLPEALAEAQRYFSFPAFDMVFDSVAHFGRADRAVVAVANVASQEMFKGLRTAVADAQRRAGIFASRGKHEAHLTLGYADGIPKERRNIEPFRFRVDAIELVASDRGKSHHERLERWPLYKTS
jgi:2'-5' RNA ligase